MNLSAGLTLFELEFVRKGDTIHLKRPGAHNVICGQIPHYFSTGHIRLNVDLLKEKDWKPCEECRDIELENARTQLLPN